MDESNPSKAGLLAEIRTQRDAWNALVDSARNRLDEPGVEGAWSLKQVLAHMAGYERWFAAMLRAGFEGREAPPEELYGRGGTPPMADKFDVETYNAWIAAQAASRPAAEIHTEQRETSANLIKVVDSLPEDALRDRARFPWLNGRSVAEILPEQSYAHWQAHAVSVRAWLDRTAS